MGVLYTEGRTDAQASEAEKVMHILTTAYPGHPWAVRVGDGFIFIRHLAFPGTWGMNLKTAAVDHDAAVLRKKIVLLAGEWLERAGFARGRSQDQEPGRVEGVPETPTVEFSTVVNAADHQPMREEARPQVAKEMAKP